MTFRKVRWCVSKTKIVVRYNNFQIGGFIKESIYYCCSRGCQKLIHLFQKWMNKSQCSLLCNPCSHDSFIGFQNSQKILYIDMQSILVSKFSDNSLRFCAATRPFEIWLFCCRFSWKNWLIAFLCENFAMWTLNTWLWLFMERKNAFFQLVWLI